MEGKPPVGAVSRGRGELTDSWAKELSDLDLSVIEEAWTDLAGSPPPAENRYLGGLVGVAGIVLMLVWPPVADRLPAGAFLNPFVLTVGILLLVGGPVYALVAGGSAKTAASAVMPAFSASS